jgi:large subunit ribosomal protein L1
LMPSPKAWTVVQNITQAIEEFKKWKIEFKLDKTWNINVGIGKTSFTVEQIQENINAFLKALEENKPIWVKWKLIKKIVISSTMSPWIQIQY